jgi:hypothetical protein
MKINKAIMSSNDDPMYLDFWEPVSKVWKEKFNIEPVLVFIGDDETPIDETYGTVIRFKPIDSIPVYLQTLWVRYWIPSQFPNDISIISDIDMFPLSKFYFIEQLESIDDNQYVHINPVVASYGTLPSCYHIAKGSVYKNVLELHDTWEESITFLNNLQLGKDPGGNLTGRNKWFADEEHSSMLVLQKNPILINRLADRRIDRSNWKYDPSKVISGEYYDSHSIRPYKENKEEIDKLISLIS